MIAVLIALTAACGGPPPTKINRLYQGLADPLPRTDPSILAGRRIVVDPGHGGHFRGTMGRDSLEESTVNLGVGLYLWGLLREAGAEVWLTRSVDRDFLAPEDSALATDLQARIAMSDSLNPDVFVSIHHNAQPKRNPDYNRIETYYKSGDPASLDLAFAIHRHLMRNIGIDAGEVRPGNYYVLRNNDAAAVLGESSYLTHPPVEERLRLSDALRLEAEAYFLGILDYFSRGIPKIHKVSEYYPEYARVPILRYQVGDSGGLGIDPDGIAMALDGHTVTPRFRTGEEWSGVTYQLPWDTPNRQYEIELTVRNLLGNTSPVYRDTAVVDLPVETALFDNQPSHPGGVMRVRARLLDIRGVPVREGTPVSISTSLHTSPFDAAVIDGRVDIAFRAPDRTQTIDVTIDIGGRTFASTVDVTATTSTLAGDYRPLKLTDARTGAPIENGVVTVGGATRSTPGSDGVYFVPRSGSSTVDQGPWVVSAHGYIPIPYPFDADGAALAPWLDGVLHGKKFMIDPEGGRARDIGMGQLGLSASEVNLRVAGYLAGFLRAAGAQARLTRTTEAVGTPEDIARMTNRWGADRYVEIRHRAEPDDSSLSVKTFHFPGSRNGVRFAADVGQALARRLGVSGRPATDRVTYPLQQTACPAIIVEAPTIAKVEEEMRLDDPWYLREQAYAIFLGIVDHYLAPEGSRVEVTIDGGGHWMVELGGTWHLLTGPDGHAAFEFVEPGLYMVRSRRGDRELPPYSITVPADQDTIRIAIPASPRDAGN